MTSPPDPADDLYEGRDGWLFLTRGNNRVLEQYGRPGVSRRTLWRWRRIIETRRRACARLGALYLHAVAPEKLTIYPDLAEGLTFDPARAPALRLARWLTGSPGARAWVDLVGPLRAARDGPPLYLRTDTHWTHRGCDIAHRAILARMGLPPRADLEARREAGPVPFSGDLGRKFGPHRTETAPGSAFASGARRTYANGLLTEMEALGRGGDAHLGTHAVFRNGDPGADPRRLVIFGDSYAQHTAHSPVATLTALFADRFREVHFLWSTGIDWHYLEGVRPDFVLAEIAERFLIDLPPRGIRIERLAELARERKVMGEGSGGDSARASATAPRSGARPPPDAPASVPEDAGAGPR